MPEKFRRIEKVRTFDSVLHELRSAIEEGRLEAGEKLPSEPSLAAQLGVSRSILREALKTLELSGYIFIRRGYGGGTFVADSKPEEFEPIPAPSISAQGVTVDHLHELRLAIEPVAGRLAATRLSLRERVELEELSAYSLVIDRPARVLDADARFHLAICRMSGNPVFESVTDALRPVMFRAFQTAVLSPVWREARQAEHDQIVEAIRAGDPQRAEAAITEHLRREVTQ